MGKKRKADKASSGARASKAPKHDESMLSIRTYEDVADSEDEFHVGRDQILLEETATSKRQRRLEEDEEFLEPSDEEVLAVDGDESLSSSEEDASEDDDDDDDDEEEIPDSRALNSRSRQKRLRAGRTVDSDASAASEDEDEEDDNGWGTSRKDYYGADAIETEADALEEETEARRLQQKHLQNMTDADYGLDEIDWLEEGSEDEANQALGEGGVVTEKLPKFEIPEDLGVKEREGLLKSRYPEFGFLSKEFLALRERHRELLLEAKQSLKDQDQVMGGTDDDDDDEDPPRPLAVIKYRALSVYMASLSMYFALLSSGPTASEKEGIAMPPDELRHHVVMQTMLNCRILWERVNCLTMPEQVVELTNGNHKSLFVNLLPDQSSKDPKPVENDAAKKREKKREHKEKKARRDAQALAAAHREERLRQVDESLADLAVRTKPSRDQHAKSAQTTGLTMRFREDEGENSGSDLGDPTSLTAQEAAEKARKRKSLRFYTSQIAQKSKKRDEAGRGAGGDTDIPYRERWRDRQQRLNEEAEKRGDKSRSDKKTRGKVLEEDDESDGNEGGADLSNQQRMDAMDGTVDEDEEYYDMVARRGADKKAARRAKADKAQDAADMQAAMSTGNDEAGVGPDGKRGITYAIAKNKGLHQHRKKEVRNPRVKKRMRFEDKKKKLKSVRAVYKGEREGKGGYGGEKTGINRGLVRSVKL